MRASLPQPLIKLPQPLIKRRRSRPEKRKPAAVRAPDSAPAAVQAPDLAVQRVRHAGGPVDRALYTCGCGHMFLARVSTTVDCPHCSAPQAW